MPNKITILKRQIHLHKDTKKKCWWETYVKHDTHFLGVSMSIVRRELQTWYRQEGIEDLSPKEKLNIALSLFDNKFAEEKIAGILFLELYTIKNISWKKLLKSFQPLFTKNLIYDWNICDWFCVKVLFNMIKQNGMECAKAVSQWNGAKNVWQARCSVVAFVNLKNKNDYRNLIWQSSQKLIKREERFSKTAVGWMMRDFSKIDVNSVFDFLHNNHDFLTKEVIANSLKYNKTMQKLLLNNLKAP